LGSILAVLSLVAVGLRAQDTEESPYVPRDPRAEPFLDVAFEPTLNTPVPLDLEFMSDDGMRRPLADMIDPSKPTILAVVYYRCPTMCNLVLNGLVATLKDIPFASGEDFNVLAVSFDPTETHVTAAAKKDTYLRDYGDRSAPGWTFAVGREREIELLTAAVGFGYKYDAMDNQYSHGSGLLILTPDGRISRFLPGLMYPVLDTRLALVEAGEGKVGTLSDKIALLCYSYDPATGKYGLLINRIIMVACLITVAAVAWLILGLIRLERKRPDESVVHPTT